MTSQLHHNFQAGQAVLRADDIMTPHLKSQVNAIFIRGPQVVSLVCYRGLEWPTLFY